jgi:hypothetical protein
MVEKTVSTPVEVTNAVAFVIDDEVVDIMRTDARMAAILLSEPVIVDITDEYFANMSSVTQGMKYDAKTNTFSNPEE